MVAQTWQNVNMTFDYSFQRDRNYKIIGMNAVGVSALAARIHGKTGSSEELLGSRPGVIAATTGTEEGMTFYFVGTDYVFNGLNPPSIDWLSTTTDTAEECSLLIVPL